MADEAPSNVTSLLARLRNHCQTTGNDETRAQRHLAAMVVAQLLRKCGSVVKGGRNLEIRYGLAATRASSDLDTVRRPSFDDFFACLEDALDEGWAGFGGRVRDRGRIAAPVPDGYQPHRLDVVLTYNGKTGVGTVTLEVAVEEAGGLESIDVVESDEATSLFTAVGLPSPDRVAVLPVPVQIAQKLHACTTPDEGSWVNERAHDLVDLQLLRRDLTDHDLQRTLDACVRLFAARQHHPWPPHVTAREGWGVRYAEERSSRGRSPRLGAGRRCLGEPAHRGDRVRGPLSPYRCVRMRWPARDPLAVSLHLTSGGAALPGSSAERMAR